MSPDEAVLGALRVGQYAEHTEASHNEIGDCRMRNKSAFVRFIVTTSLVLAIVAITGQRVTAAGPPPFKKRKVSAHVQLRPGGPAEEASMGVHEVPVDPAIVPASASDLADDELVLGVVRDGAAVAYPIRLLAMFEVVNSRVGKTPVAPTW